jgi:chromosome segregation ATPase
MSLVVSNGQQPFLIAFDESLRKLNAINDAITKNTENKRNFTGYVLTKLEELHEKIKAIVIKITEIKQKIIELQDQVGQNNNGIQEKERELADLKQQLDQLTNERNNLTTELDQVKTDANANTTRLQQQIDATETQLRDVTTKNNELETYVLVAFTPKPSALLAPVPVPTPTTK